MNEFLQNFHFIRPLILLLLILPAIALLFRKKAYDELSSWEEVCDKNLLNYLLIKGQNRRRKNLFLLIWTGLVSAIISASGPTWKQVEMPALYEQNPLVIALELSTDMDNSSNNLQRARYMISDILRASPNTQSGLIVYTKEPFMVSPISEDYRIIENILPAVDISIMPANGNNSGRAVALATEKLKNAGFSYGNILLITTDSGENAVQAIKSAQNAKNSGYKVSVIQVSGQTDDMLRKIAESGGGIYLNSHHNPLEFSEFINHNFDKTSEESKNKISIWEDYGYYLLFIPMFCCLLLFRRGIFAFILMFFAVSNAYAGFFLNNNQEGLKAFNENNFTKAAEKFEDTNWQGSAFYRAGNFAEALEKFSLDSSETGLYNQGNALAKSGKIEDAIKKYEKVLELNPQNKDAEFNLEYLKKQQENQQNQNSSGNDENNEENQQNNDSQSASGEQEQEENQQNNQPDSSQANEQNQNQQNSGAQNNQAEPQENEAGENDNQEQESDATANQGEDSENQPTEQQDTNRNQDGEKNDNQNNAQASFAPLQNDDEQITSEEALAKAQQYRLIETDPGGLLREFIRAEYEKNRYKD